MSPDPRERDLVKCEDMRLHAERAVQYLDSRSLAEFLHDDMVQAAVIRCVEVIGEAARLVSEETRQRTPAIPWPLIVGMRHILAHDYGTVNLDKVYAVVREHLPELIKHLENLIAKLEQETDWSDDDGA
jgi:uncharacterized protein with HEPN domain